MSLAWSKGKLYAASPKYLYVIDAATGKTRLLPGTIFRHSNFNTGNKMLIVDRRQWVWLVSYKNAGSVDVYDTRRQRTFKVRAPHNYAVNAIAEDRDGNIWYATDRGLVRVKVTQSENPRFQYFCFNVNNDNQRTFYNLRALLCLDNNMLLAGTTSGYQMVEHQDNRQDPWCPRPRQPAGAHLAGGQRQLYLAGGTLRRPCHHQQRPALCG
jgi:hypothetical protein